MLRIGATAVAAEEQQAAATGGKPLTALTSLDLSNTQLLEEPERRQNRAQAQGQAPETEGRGLTELALALARPAPQPALKSLSLADNCFDVFMRPSPDAPAVRAAATLADALICSQLVYLDLRRASLSLMDEGQLALSLLDAEHLSELRCTPSWRPALLDFTADHAIGAIDDDGGDMAGGHVGGGGGGGGGDAMDVAASDAATAAGYLDEHSDRVLQGEAVPAMKGGLQTGTHSMVALRWTEQLAIEHGGRLKAARAGAGLPPTGTTGSVGSTALHWLCAQPHRVQPTGNGVEWMRWLLQRRPADAGLRDAQGRTPLDYARLADNPRYIGLLQNAVEAACTYRGRYILTSTAEADQVESGGEMPVVRYNGIDRTTGTRIELRCLPRSAHAAWQQEAELLRRIATVRYAGRGGAVPELVNAARSFVAGAGGSSPGGPGGGGSGGGGLLIGNIIEAFKATPLEPRLDEHGGNSSRPGTASSHQSHSSHYTDNSRGTAASGCSRPGSSRPGTASSSRRRRTRPGTAGSMGTARQRASF